MARTDDSSQPFAVEVENDRTGQHSRKFFATDAARSTWVRRNEERFTVVAWSDPSDS